MNISNSAETPRRPVEPSRALLADELGIAFGAPNSRSEINRRRKEAPSWRAYEAALAAWDSHPEVVAERARRAQEDLEFLRRREERLALAAKQREESKALWLALPCRWRRQRLSLCAAAAATVAHMIYVEVKKLGSAAAIKKSPSSETRYVRCGTIELRISDHDLGYGDYGSRKQVHRGPEVVFTAETAADPGFAFAEVLAAVREHAETLTCRFARQDAAALIRAIRAAAEVIG